MGMCRTAALGVLLLLATVVRFASSEFIEYYGLLGVPRDVKLADLKKSFRKRSVELHPDKNRAPDAVEQFHTLQNAIECLSDPKSRKYYDLYEENWAEMKEYKEKHLKSYQRQMIQQGGRMYMKNAEVDIEEMFWGERHVQMLHQSFAAKMLGNFPGVWVLFFGNPNCGPCRQSAPKIKHFAREVAAKRDWLRVGTVNMGVNSNGNLLDSFGSASNSIPQIVLVAPALGTGLGLDARLADFEIFDRGDDGGWDFSRRLLAACERLKTSAVKELGASAGSSLAKTVANGQLSAAVRGGPDADPNAKWLVLVVNGSNTAATLVPVFRRLAHRSQHAGCVFRVLRCEDDGGEPAASAQACREAGSVPELRLYAAPFYASAAKNMGQPELLLAMDPGELLGGAAEDAGRYGYGLEQTGFGIFAEAVLRMSSPGEERFPTSLVISGCPHHAFLNGPLALIGTSNGRPMYKQKSNNVYLRWLTGSQRNGQHRKQGIWILTDTPEPIDQSWAYMVLDDLVPIGGEGWMVLSDKGGFSPASGMAVANNEDWAQGGRGTPAGAGIRTEL